MKKANGILLSANPSKEEIGKALEDVLFDDNADSMKEYARQIWRERFDAVSNARIFAKHICDLDSDIKEVLLVTNGYPFGGEKSFIEQEVIALSTRYDLTIIAVVDKKETLKGKESAINNIEKLRKAYSIKNKIKVLCVSLESSTFDFIKNIPAYFFDKRIRLEKKEIILSKNKILLSFWESIKFYSKAKLFSKFLENNPEISIKHNTLIYTFWYLYPTLSFCLNNTNNKIITRTHGYDLYDFRIKGCNRQPFKTFMDSKLSEVLFACKSAKDYYLRKYRFSEDKKKYQVLYLGSIHNEENEFVKKERNNDFRIVSCSHMIPLKRIDLIVDGLAELIKNNQSKNIEWVHFGDGTEKEKIIQYAKEKLTDKVHTVFMGNVDNDTIHQYYANNYVDCFITTSSTEGGVPVSIQEALAYGIPVVGTNVGGITEAFID